MVDFHRDVYCLLGLPFDAVSMSQAIDRIHRAAAGRQRCFLSTPNISFVIGCLDDREFRASIVNSDLSVADGMPLVWIARLLGIPIRERVTGSGMFEALRGDISRRISVYFFGGPAGVAEKACEQLNRAAGGAICAGHDYPGFGSIAAMSDESTIARINASGADFLVVAMGAKKGQAWIEHNRGRITVPVISHLGAVVNFAAGAVHRAPGWMQRSGFEWLWRIKEEPKLFYRYFRDGTILLTLLITRVIPYIWYLKRHWPDNDQLAGASAVMRDEGPSCIVNLRGAWTRNNIGPLRDCLAGAALAGKDIRLEMGAVTFMDSAVVALLALLHGHQIQHHRQLQFVSLQLGVRRIIEYCCAEYMLT